MAGSPRAGKGLPRETYKSDQMSVALVRILYVKYGKYDVFFKRKKDIGGKIKIIEQSPRLLSHFVDYWAQT